MLLAIDIDISLHLHYDEALYVDLVCPYPVYVYIDNFSVLFFLIIGRVASVSQAKEGLGAMGLNTLSQRSEGDS